MNSNNKNYIDYKYFNKFNILTKNIKITNLINIYLNIYLNAIINYFLRYTKDHLINISFSYFIIKDFFINIFDKKHFCYYEIESLVKKKLYFIDKYKKNYSNFFL
jgi:hypothetical protein